MPLELPCNFLFYLYEVKMFISLFEDSVKYMWKFVLFPTLSMQKLILGHDNLFFSNFDGWIRQLDISNINLLPKKPFVIC